MKKQKQLHCIPRLENIEQWTKIAEQYGAAFEYNDFFMPQLLDTPEQLERVVREYEGLDRDRKADTLHGVFFDIVIGSEDKKIAEVCEIRLRQSMETATRLGLKAVIFHTNFITNFNVASYKKRWVDYNAMMIRTLLRDYPDMRIYMENMFDVTPDLLLQLAEKLAKEERFGVCLDIAHANLSSCPIEEWVEKLGPYIKHLHINDNFGDADSHFAVGDGNIDWNILNHPVIREKKPSILLEVRSAESFLRSVKYLQERELYPYDSEKSAVYEKKVVAEVVASQTQEGVVLSEDTKRILDIGIKLTSEKSYAKLYEIIMQEAMSITNCDAGTLYLCRNNQLYFMIMRTNSQNFYKGGDGEPIDMPPVEMTESNVCSYSAIHKEIINVKDVYSDENFDWKGPIKYDSITGFHTQSMLVIPLVNHEGKVLGVLQLINALDKDGTIIPFDPAYEYIIYSLASQASISLSNQVLIQELRELMSSFVTAMTTAIDSRTPYNANHTRMVAQYCDEMAGFIHEAHLRGETDYDISEENRQQLVMAAKLHDVGKMIIPLSVMNKATRVEEELPLMYKHWDYLRAELRICYLEGKLDEDAYKEKLETLEEGIRTTEEANSAGFLQDALYEKVKQLGELRFPLSNGGEERFLTPVQQDCLLIRKGTLTQEERAIIESHVEYTAKILNDIRFGDSYDKVRAYASSHHEFLDGSGYPNKLVAEQLSTEMRLMTVMDIYEALTSNDRPYRKSIPTERALSILESMVEEGKLDQELVALTGRYMLQREQR